jgi:formylglycine-generating enzyme required for sulfatase activity
MYKPHSHIMKAILIALLATMLPLTIPASSVTPAQLSEAARAFLPEVDSIDLILQDGRTLRGELLEEREEGYIIRVTSGTITARRAIPRSEISEVVKVGLDTHVAKGLKTFNLHEQDSLKPEEYRNALALFEEFLGFFPDNPDAADIAARQEAFREEYTLIERGMRKIAGEWYSPVQAAVLDFQQTAEKMAEMEQQHRGIQLETWNTDREARTKYDELRDQGREIAREVPRIMNERLPFLLQEKNFDEAFLEMNAFVRFWIAGVIEAEARASDRNRMGRGVFEGMDFDYLQRLQRRIMEPYAAILTAERSERPPVGMIIPDERAYIPGGYFFMGNPKATPAHPDFPFRVVHVKPFLMDRYQVTNAQYREFLEYVRSSGDYSMSHPAAPPLKDHTPAGWSHPELRQDNQPVVGVDWFDAYAYLNWRGQRLPTEAEWEIAARGRDGRTYPWGETPPARMMINTPTGRTYIAGRMDEQVPPPQPPPPSRFSCNRQPPPPPESIKTVLPATTWPVDQLMPPEARSPQFTWERIDPFSLNPYGIYHMAGNAAEWVADWYDPTYYTKVEWDNPQGPERGRERTFRGASFLCASPDLATTFNRRHPDTDSLKRGIDRSGKPMIGIRGARDLP